MQRNGEVEGTSRKGQRAEKSIDDISHPPHVSSGRINPLP